MLHFFLLQPNSVAFMFAQIDMKHNVFFHILGAHSPYIAYHVMIY